MGNRKFFRRSFRGFHRRDVLTYIDNLRTEQQQEISDLQEQLNRALEHSGDAAAERESALSLQQEALQEQMEQLNRDRAAEQAENEALRAKVTDYEAEIQQLHTQLDECNRSLAAMWEEQRQLQQSAQAAQEFLGDVRRLEKEWEERIEDCAKIRFGGEMSPSETSEEPTEKTAEESAGESRPAMEQWLF